jgi:hypothetical protein
VPHGRGWFAAALATFALCLGLIVGCTEVGLVDGRTEVGRTKQDTLIIETTKSDTVVQSDVKIVTDTVIKEIVVRDTVRRVDTIVMIDTIRREPERIATVYKVDRFNNLDSVVIDISSSTTMNVTGPSTRPRFEFETLIPLSRRFRDDRFAPHGWSSLFIFIPDMEIRPGSIQLERDPDNFDPGAELVVRDRTLTTGDKMGWGQWSWGNFIIETIDTRARVISAHFRAKFYQGGGMPADSVEARFRLGY